ncbi:MAG: HEAT repeat domain-containing protein [Anaerolineales bacterium]
MEIDALVAALTAGDDEQAEAAAQQLASHGAAALAALHPLLRSDDPDVRWWAVRTLGEVSAAGVTQLLLRQLDDPNENVQAAAIHGLGLSGNAAAAEPLAAKLSVRGGYIARQAGEALVKLGDAAVSVLLDALQDGDQGVRVEAARALAHMTQAEAIPELFNALDDESALVSYWADIGLDKRGVGQVYFKP